MTVTRHTTFSANILRRRRSSPPALPHSWLIFSSGIPGEILARLNAELCRDNESCMFVTFFCAILNIRTGQVDYSNGGHNLPYYLHHDGISPLENAGGRALGLAEQSPYASGRMVLGPG